MKKILTLSITLILVAGIVSMAKSADIDTNVGRSYSTAYPRDRLIVKTSAGTIVVLYRRGISPAGTRAKKSTDNGDTWRKLDNTPSGSTYIDVMGEFSTCLDADDNIYVAYEYDDDIYFRKLTYTVSGGTWTVEDEYPVTSTGEDENAYNPSIIRQSNGTLWISYGYDISSDGRVKSRYSTNDGVSWGNIANVSAFDPTADANDYWSALVIRNTVPFIVYADMDENRYKWSYWNVSAWETPATISTNMPNSGDDFSITTTGNDVHLVYNQSLAGIRHRYYDGSWQGPWTLSSDTDDKNVSLTTNDSDLWVFISSHVATNQYNIRYKMRSGGSWEETWTPVIEDNANNRYSTTPLSTTEYIPLVWTEGTDPYTVRFDSSVVVVVATTYTWTDGAANGVWADANNWSGGTGYPDDKNDKAIINMSTRTINTPGGTLNIGELVLGGSYTGTLALGETLTLDSSGEWNGSLTIGTGTTLDLAGNTLSGTSSFTNSGTLKLQGGETTDEPTNNPGSTVEYTATSSSRAIKDWTYHHLKINGSGGTFTVGAGKTLGGNLTIAAGTFDLNGYTVNVSSNFFKSGGTLYMHSINDELDIVGDFTVTGGTADINVSGADIYIGGNIDISGDNSFVPLSGSYYMDEAGDATVSITGANNDLGYGSPYTAYFYVEKTNPTDTVTLLTDMDGNHFIHNEGIFDVNGSSASFSGVYYAYNGAKLQMSSGTFRCGRNVYIPGSHGPWWVDVGWTENISGGTITVYGGKHATYGTAYFTNGSNFTPTGGTFQLVGTDAASIYIAEEHDAHFNFYNLTIGDGTNTKTVEMHASSYPLDVNANFTVKTNATFDTSEKAVDVASNVDIDGIFTANGSTITVAGNWDSSAGTFNYGTSTVDLTGTGNLKTRYMGSAYSLVFYNLKVAAAGKTTTMLGSHVGVADTLTIGDGILIDPATTYYLSLLKNNGTPLNLGNATITLKRIVYRPSNGTVTVTGGNYGTLNLLLFPTASGATFNLDDSSVTVNGTFWLLAPPGINNVVCDTNDKDITATRLYFGGGSANDGSTTLNLRTSTIDIGTTGVDMSTNGGSHILDLSSATVTCEGNWQLVDGSGSITQIPGTSTVTFDSNASTMTITLDGSSFADVVFDSGDGNGIWELQDSFTCSSLQLLDKKLIDNNQTVTVNGDIIIADANNLLASGGTWIQGADGNISNPNWWENKFTELQIADGVTSTRTGSVLTRKLILGANATLGGGGSVGLVFPTVNDFIDMGSDSDVTGGGISITPYYVPFSTRTQKAISVSAPVSIGWASSSTIRMTGDWTTGNLTIHGGGGTKSETSAVVLDTNGNNLTVNGNLELGWDTASGHYGKILLSTGTHTITGDVGVGSNADTHGYFDLGSADTSIAGNSDFTRATVTPGTSTVTFNVSSGTQTVTSAGESFYHLVINSTGTSVQLQDAADIDGGLTISTGTLKLNSYDITISSDVSISGSGLLTCSSGEQITVGGNWSASSGATFTAASSTTTFNGNGSFDILSSGTTFYNLLFNNNVSTWTLTDALYVKNDFTQLNGAFDTNSSGNYPLTIGDDITISGGTFYARVSTITLSGSNSDGSADWDSYGGMFTWGTSTVDLKETGTIKGSDTQAWNRPFYNLTCAYPDKTNTLITTTIAVHGTFRVQGGTITHSGNRRIMLHDETIPGIEIVNGSTISVYELEFDGPQNVPGYDYDTRLTVWSSGEVSQVGDVTCNGLWVDGGGYASRSPTWNTAGYSLTINGGLKVGGTSGEGGTHTFNAYGSTITVSGNVTLNHPDGNAYLNLSTSNMSVAGNWTITNGTVNPGTSSVTFYGTGTSILKDSTTFYVLISTTTGKTVKFSSDTVTGVTGHLNFENITLRSDPLDNATWYLNLQGTQDVHDVDVKDSNADDGNTIYAGSSIDSGNNTNWVFDDSILTWDGSESTDWDTAQNWNFNIVPLSTHTIIIPNVATNDPQLNSNVTISSITIQTGGELSLNNYNITVSSDVYISSSLICSNAEQITIGGNWSAYSGATFTASSSTVTFNGSGSFDILSSGTTFYNLAFSNSISTWTLTDALYLDGDFTITNSSGNVNSNSKNLTIAGDFTVNGGKFTAGVSTITVAGDWDSSGGAFYRNTSTVDLTGIGNLKTTGGWGYHFRNLKVAATNKTTTILSNVGVEDTLTIGSGALTDGAFSYLVILWKNSEAPLNLDSGATITVARIVYRPSNGTVTVTGENYGTLDYLELYPSASNATFNLGGDVTVNGTFWLVAGAANPFTCNTQNNNITATRLMFGLSGTDGSTTLNLGSSIINISTGGVDMASNGGSHTFNLNTSTVTCEGDWELVDGSGSIDQNWGTSTVTFDNASSTSTLTGSTTFYVLISTTTGKNVKFTSDIVIGVTNHLNFENITLRSTLNGATWYLNLSGTQDVSNVDVQDSNASGGDTIVAFGTNTDSGNNTNWDFAPPAAINDLSGECDSQTGYVTLSWSTPGDDEWTGVLSSTSEYRIDYSTDSSRQWDKDTYEVSIPTYGVTPHTEVSRKITGLTGGSTYYFRIWTADEIPRWSGLSNGCTVWVNPILSVSISTDTYNFGEFYASTITVSSTYINVTNDGNVNETYSIKCSSFTTHWLLKDAPGSDEFTVQAAFHLDEPNNNDIDWEADDILTKSLQQCTTAVFSIDNSQNGKNVLPFESNIRDIWFRLKTPLSTSTTTQQNITVTISAEQESP